MMAALDQRSLILMISLLYLVLPLTVWLVMGRPRAPGPLLWCVGGLMGGVGFALMGLRGQIPDMLSYTVGQTVLLSSPLLAAQGLRHDLGRPWRKRTLAVPLLMYALGLHWLLPRLEAPDLGVLLRLVNLAVIALLARTAWQLSRAEASRHALIIAGVYTVQCGLIALNLSTAWLGSAEIDTLSGSAANRLAYFGMIMVALLACMAYLGLSLERATRTTLQLTQDAARNELWQQRRQALVTADRHRLMTTLTDSLGQAMLIPLQAALVQLRQSVGQLRQGRDDPARLRGSLQQTVDGILQAHDTVNRIRSLVRPEAPNNELVDLGQLLHDLEPLVAQRALRQHTRLVFPAGLHQVYVHGDALALTHALLQLVDNALSALNQQDNPVEQDTKQEQKTIGLQVRADGMWWTLDIHDNGPGFPAPVLRRFGSHSEPSSPSLQGLGLFVVQGIVRQHGGTLSLDNPVGGGARVTLRLPQLP